MHVCRNYGDKLLFLTKLNENSKWRKQKKKKGDIITYREAEREQNKAEHERYTRLHKEKSALKKADKG